MSAQSGRPSATAATPWAVANHLGLNWRTAGEGGALLTWETLLDLAVVAYWTRRPARPVAVATEVAGV